MSALKLCLLILQMRWVPPVCWNSTLREPPTQVNSTRCHAFDSDVDLYACLQTSQQGWKLHRSQDTS